MTPLEAALEALAAGLAVVPPAEDGTKRPVGNWKRYQAQPPTEAEIRTWYRSGRSGVGLVCGAVSGGLELLEFEDEATYQQLVDAARELGLAELIERVDGGYCERTPGGGIHWLYRCQQVTGNAKLARRPGPEGPQVLIETRGEGGYVVIAPSNGAVHPTGRPYALLRGGLTTIATISADERASLMRLARSFDQLPATTARAGASPAAVAGGRPGDDFNLRASWAEILEPHGWTLAYQRDDVGYWRKPGKRSPRGHSATTDHGGSGLLWVFSTATAFEAERSYTKFAAYALLRHGGDYRAAAKDLAAQGYGDQRDRQTTAATRRDPLDELLEAMGAYLHLDDPDHVLFALAVAVSAELDGPPLWGQLVGAPSGGKTEAIEILRDRAAHLDELTAAGLLTWQPGKGKGNPPTPAGALVRLGDRGLLTIGDMSTVIAGSDRSGSAREQLFANLRRIFDGSLNRDIGAPPGASGPLRWRGRATILAACTPAIDRYTAHGDALGPRWIYFRLAQADAKAERERQQKVWDVDQLEERQALVRRLANTLVDTAAARVGGISLPQPMAEAIFDAAQVACWGRAAVPRHGYGKREIDGLPVIESTPRITRQLLMLARCLLALEVDDEPTLALVRRAALDSMPEIRRRILQQLCGGAVVTGREVARELECDVGVAIRTLEDLAAIGLVAWPDEPADDDGARFPPPKLWHLRDGERRLLLEAVFAQVPPVAETDFYPPPPPPKIKGTGQSSHHRKPPVSTSATGATSEDAPPPLTDADDPALLGEEAPW
jgi:hypothetical protein